MKQLNTKELRTVNDGAITLGNPVLRYGANKVKETVQKGVVSFGKGVVEGYTGQ
ncbi:hypothetical protein [Staphylococcus auricularis]|uniref:hypothetical protein n=1 Tax=Staphylococcus auricularis TaxID=29379 RepID=UPI001932968F|nr:hypothetical protein [Staphylococcus auricularis]MCG7340773.1 hypothetical protein [Staphylococcus auricularis]